MSYHTKVEMGFHGGPFRSQSGPDPIALIKSRVEEFRRLDQREHPGEFDQFFLDGIEKAFQGEEIHIAGYQPYIPIRRLLMFLSQSFEDARFSARGWGEEYWDVWFFEYKNGDLKISTLPSELKTPVTSDRLEGWFTRASDATTGRRTFLRPEFLKKAVVVLLACIIILVFAFAWLQVES